LYPANTIIALLLKTNETLLHTSQQFICGHDFPGQIAFFQDFPVLDNATIKFQDFPGFSEPVQTLSNVTYLIVDLRNMF